MRLSRTKRSASSRYRVRANQRPSTKFALAVSLTIHVLIVVALYEAYTELINAPPMNILARGTASERASAPSFALREPAPSDKAHEVDGPRPAAQIPPLPRPIRLEEEQVPVDDSIFEMAKQMRPWRVAHGISPRVTAPAILPAAKVRLPTVGVGAPILVADARGLAPQITPLERATSRSEVLATTGRALPLRIASRPTYGSIANRPSRLAMLAAGQRHDTAPTRDRRPAEAFARRGTAQSTPPECGAAIESGLAFLALVQQDDGRWRFDDLRGTVDVDAELVSIRGDTAATGLALLAFLGAGYDHFDGRYRWVVQDALDYLTIVQRPSGELFLEDRTPTGQVIRFYSHGIATLALCEAFGMTGDAKLSAPTQRAIDHLAATQNRDMGGWRYLPGVNTDLSVTGWQLVALRSGQRAGLDVPSDTFARIGECLEMCRDDENRPGLYRYNPWASPNDPLTRHGRQPSTVMTAVGLTMELYQSSQRDDQLQKLGAEHLMANLPTLGDASSVAPIGTLGNPERDTYYWYYGTQAMYHIGGDYWQAWSRRLEPLLVESQTRRGRLAGSWDPHQPISDKWADYGGRLYVTAMNLLSLEIHQRHLPLEQFQSIEAANRPQ
jgi:hypothetical protein